MKVCLGFFYLNCSLKVRVVNVQSNILKGHQKLLHILYFSYYFSHIKIFNFLCMTRDTLNNLISKRNVWYRLHIHSVLVARLCVTCCIEYKIYTNKQRNGSGYACKLYQIIEFGLKERFTSVSKSMFVIFFFLFA